MLMNEFICAVHENAVKHGFWDDRDSHTIEEILALVHAEWSEALEEYRANRPMVWYKVGDDCCTCEKRIFSNTKLCRALTCTASHKPEGRITPAHAGKSVDIAGGRRKPPDHPRPRGEKTRLKALVPAIPGSPPPMRGKAKLRLCFLYGKDHPRTRGERLKPSKNMIAHGLTNVNKEERR